MTHGEDGRPAPSDDFRFDLTRPAAPVAGELDYASTVTAPTEWVPYVYTDTELRVLAGRRWLSIAAAAFGLSGLGVAIFGVWGAPLSLSALVFAIAASRSEPAGRPLWISGLASGGAGLVIVIAWCVIITQAQGQLPR